MSFPQPSSLLELEELAQAPGLSAAHRDLSLLAIVHAQLITALEPRHDFLDVVDVHHVGAVSSPENGWIQELEELFDRPALGLSFQGGRHHGDDALLDGGEADILLIGKQEPVMRLQNNLPAAGTHTSLLLFDEAE